MQAKLSAFRFIRHLAVTILMILAHFSELQAAEPVGWSDLGLYGGQMNAIAIDPVDPNIMFTGSYFGDGLFHSTNGSGTWQAVEGFRNESVYDVDFDPTSHTTIWVTTYWYIYKSEDGGITWSSFDPGDPWYGYYRSLAIDPTNGNTVYIGTTGPVGSDDNARVYKTTDGGTTWQKISLRADHNVVDFAINPQNPQEIWAVTGPAAVENGSIYRSRDGGASWEKINTGLYRGWFYVVAINPQDPRIVYVGGENGVYRTKDGGATWFQLEPDNYCRGLTLDPQNPNTVYARWYDYGGVLSKSTDGGDTWITHSIEPLQFICLTADPLNSQVLYGGDVNLGIYRSSTGGETWQPANQGISANPVYATAISPSETLLVGTLSGVYLKNPAGSWGQVNPLISHAVAFSPEDENTLYAGFDWKFGKSTDSGETWSYVYISSSSTPHGVESIATTYQDPEMLYLGVSYSGGTKGEIYKSTDGGESIRLVKSLPVPVNVVELNPQNPQVVYAGSGDFYNSLAPGAVYKSIDGGETWEEVGLTQKTVNAFAFDPENPDTVYAGCGSGADLNSGVFRSTDGGITWQEKDFGVPKEDGIAVAVVDIGIDPENRNILYAGTIRDGIYLGYDGDEYWTLLGLSDYYIFDILVPSLSPTVSKLKGMKESELQGSGELFAGSGSGMLEFTGSGMGIITGTVTDVETSSGITGATVSTDTGGVALSLTGHYLMNCPAGRCTVSASMAGYQKSSLSGVVVTSGEKTENIDFSLEPATEEPVPECPAELILNNDESPLSVIRDFRDRVLNKTAEGLILSELYSRHSWELTSIFLRNENLKKAAGDVIRELMPGIRSVVTGGTMTISATQLDDIASLTRGIAFQANPELKSALGQLMGMLNADRCFDLENIGINVLAK